MFWRCGLIGMTNQPNRPFYTEYAWAFDLLIDRPVRKECAAIAAWMIERGVPAGSALLDAGCGSGRYSVELARRGYFVHGVDRSAELIAVANGSVVPGAGSISLAVGDILALSGGPYDAVLCRGVLNDLIDDGERQAAFDRFAHVLRPGGVLILDVREWVASATRKSREPVFRKRVSTDRGELTFTSTTRVDAEQRTLVISEEHVLTGRGRERAAQFQFVMRCWTREELRSTLKRNGFEREICFGAYNPAVEPGATDRLVVVAQRVPE
jgi:SAM-dependent methyltransferase